MYRSARRETERFFIGIEANARPLAKISERIYRRPEKGGAPNALFLQASVEDLPNELNGVVDELHIQLPWGSLLSGVAIGNELILKNLRRLCRGGAKLEVLIGIDPERDHSELRRLRLPTLSAEYLRRVLVPAYESSGFGVADYGMLSSAEWPEIESSWARKLRRSATRVLIYLRARAT